MAGFTKREVLIAGVFQGIVLRLNAPDGGHFDARASTARQVIHCMEYSACEAWSIAPSSVLAVDPSLLACRGHT